VRLAHYEFLTIIALYKSTYLLTYRLLWTLVNKGTEMKNFRPHPAKSLPGIQRPQPNKGNWRQKHTELIEALRNARATKKAMAEGRPLPPPPAPSLNPDYIQCPYCGRRFNETAAERHIPFCKVRLYQQTFSIIHLYSSLSSLSLSYIHTFIMRLLLNKNTGAVQTRCMAKPSVSPPGILLL